MSDDDIDFESKEIRCEVREPVERSVRVSLLDDDILSIDVAEIAQSLLKGSTPVLAEFGRIWRQKPDSPHLESLLRLRHTLQSEADSENDCEPISRMGTSVENDCGKSSRTPRRAPARRLCAPLPA